MHTAFSLKKRLFATTLDGEPVDPATVLDWGSTDRLGVVIDRPVGALGAGLLTLLTIALFYDTPAKKRRMRPIYPEIYLFHASGPWGSFVAFDFWPDHKEVFVDSDPRSMLRAINNRGITHLAVPDRARRPVEHRFKEPECAADRIKQCFAYDPAGIAENSDLLIETTDPTILENYDGVIFLGEAMAGPNSEEAHTPPRLRSKSPEEGRLAYEAIAPRLGEVDRAAPSYRSSVERIDQARSSGLLREGVRRIALDAALEMLP